MSQTQSSGRLYLCFLAEAIQIEHNLQTLLFTSKASICNNIKMGGMISSRMSLTIWWNFLRKVRKSITCKNNHSKYEVVMTANCSHSEGSKNCSRSSTECALTKVCGCESLLKRNVVHKSKLCPPSSSDRPFRKTEEWLKMLCLLRKEKLGGEMITIFRTLCREDENELVLVHLKQDKK